jgi:hypothetical protein
MLAWLAFLAFSIGAGMQAVNGPDLDAAAAWPFWLLVGFALWVCPADVATPFRRKMN